MKYINCEQWGLRLKPPVSKRRAQELARKNEKQIGAVKMPGLTGMYLIPDNAPDPRKRKPYHNI